MHTKRCSQYALLSIIALAAFSAAQAAFEVTRPDPGDTLVLEGYNFQNELYIDWTVAPGTEDSDVLITLQRGDDLDSLQTIETVNGTAPNNGSYTWDGRESVSLASGTDPWLARTACNYTIRLTIDDLVAYSKYFTIINPDDGQLPDSAVCPIERGEERPEVASATVEDTANANRTEPAGGGGGGISTSTLAVAVAVPIVVLLLVFGLLIWLGLRKGWFVKWTHGRHTKDRQGLGNGDGEMTGYSAQPYVSSVPEKTEIDSPGELHSDHRAWEAEGTQVHQLEGDERDVDVGRGYMRST